MSESLHLRPSEGPCETHDWPTRGFPRRLIQAMRDRHGKGGINVCRECIARVKAEADRERGR